MKSAATSSAVQEGFFVDSAKYPERNGDGIARKIEGGVGYGYIFERDEDYMAPVTAHYGYNNVEQYGGDPENPSALIGGCTFEDRSKIVYIDELDEDRQCERPSGKGERNIWTEMPSSRKWSGAPTEPSC